MSLVVRAPGDLESFVPAIRKVVWSVDKDQPIIRISTMNALLAASAAERHFVQVLFDTFGLVALALASIGLYGVVSGSASERTREIGVRVALGAQRRNIFLLILRQGLSLTVLGVGIGLGGAVVAGRAIASLLFGISWSDPITYVGVILLLVGVSGSACWLAARRAVCLDPILALRQE